MKQIVRAFLVLVAVMFSAGVTFAGPKQEFAACRDASVNTAIKLCTVVINNVKQSTANKSYALGYRCSIRTGAGDFENAIADCDEAIKLDPDFSEAFASRCWIHDLKGDFNKAIVDCSKAIELQPKNRDAFHNRCWAYLQKGELNLAIGDCRAALKLDPKYMNPHVNLSVIYLQQGDYDQSIFEISEFIKHDPNSFAPWNMRAAVKLAKGDLPGARSDVEKALALKGDFVEAKQTLAEIEGAENKARQTAILVARPQEKIVAVPPKVTPVQPSVADVQKEFKACEDASLETTLDLCSIVINSAHHPASDRAIAFNNRCWANMVKGEFEKALPDCDNAIGIDPQLANAFSNRCWAYADRDDFEKAIADCNEAIRLNQNHQNAWHTRGYAHYKKSEYELAMNDLNQAIRLDEKYPNPYRYRALIKLLKNDLKSARADAEKAIALDPNYAEAKETLAEIEAAEKKAQQVAVVVPPPPEKIIAPPPPPQKPLVAQKRVAMVFGNSAYADGMALPNPTNDANAVAASLKRLGFEVILATDATKAAMSDAMYRFAVLSDSADAALVFYAGHGMQVDGVNYLMPVDASLETRADLKHKFVSADEILDDLRSVKGMRMMVLDACRNNPLSRSIKLKLAKLTSRAVDNRDGLADMKAEGVLIAFATQPNEVAADGEGADSPFTLALLKHLETPNIEIDTMFKRVRTTVSEMTDGVQLPQTVNSSVGEFYLKPN
jgi:tetratricopeptide (TPR) repeat protein